MACQFFLLLLQEQIDEIVQSVRTLKLILRNPSLLTEIDDDMDQVDELVMERHRREVLTTPSDSGSDPNPTDGQAPAPAQPYLGPYSGKKYNDWAGHPYQ